MDQNEDINCSMTQDYISLHISTLINMSIFRRFNFSCHFLYGLQLEIVDDLRDIFSDLPKDLVTQLFLFIVTQYFVFIYCDSVFLFFLL